MEEEYKFESGWIFSSHLPASGTRCIVTDGELVVFATYACHHGESGTWVIPEIHSSESFRVIGWMPSPKPMKKAVPYNESHTGISKE